jgi:hypothetical protein
MITSTGLNENKLMPYLWVNERQLVSFLRSNMQSHYAVFNTGSLRTFVCPRSSFQFTHCTSPMFSTGSATTVPDWTTVWEDFSLCYQIRDMSRVVDSARSSIQGKII